MQKFKFSLQRLMDYKEILLNEEVSKIQHINKQIHDCEQNITDVTNRVEFLNKSIGASKQAYTMGVLRNYNSYINDLRGLKASFALQKNGFERSLELSRGKATTLQKEHKTISSLKEKKFDEYKKEISIKEQLLLDDLVSSRR